MRCLLREKRFRGDSGTGVGARPSLYFFTSATRALVLAHNIPRLPMSQAAFRLESRSCFVLIEPNTSP